MRNLLIFLALAAGCSDSKDNTDAGRAVLTNDCPTYCATIAANCTGANTQYQDDAHCAAACAKLPPGAAATETSGNTRGCRIYHAQNAMVLNDATTHCPHAGPGGAAISAATPAPSVCGDACTSFCTLEIATCGSLDAPIAGVPAQYQNAAACMTACGGFNKMKTLVAGATNSSGDSLACRIYHITNAAISAANAVTHCPHTAATPTGPCSGAAMP